MSGKAPTAIAVIPARYGSQRLPAKALLKESGKYLVQHVYERVREARRIARVVIATDDDRIAQAVTSFGGEFVMTRPECATGTDRVAEAATSIEGDFFVNIQGDEPEIEPALVDTVVGELQEGAEMATCATPLRNLEEAALPQRVKVVLDHRGFALYFSRSRIPYGMDAPAPTLLHLGIYGYTKACLVRLACLPPSFLEKAERLEQLRALENGVRIKVAVTESQSPGGIDTRADYDAFLQRWKGRSS